MQNESPFNGFEELLQLPLEKKDPRSFEIIKNALHDEKHSPHDPFRFLIQYFTGKKFHEQEAIEHWRCMLRHKEYLEAKLDRPIGIYAALFDFFDSIGSSSRLSGSLHLISSHKESPQEPVTQYESITRICSPGNHVEIFKREVSRAKRYKHSLSAIMLEIDDFQQINQMVSHKSGEGILTVIVKIIKKTIRVVDILYQYSGQRFLIILPDTNKREAYELSERIRQNICERTKRIFGASGITATLSVGQTMNNSNSVEFIKHLEIILEQGKKQKCNMVYSF